MIARDLIVPWRERTLAECSALIQLVVNPDGHRWTAPKQPDDQTLWRGWIEACLTEASKPLTERERDFLISIADDLTYTGRLSDAQVQWLERIYTEKV